MPIDSIGSHQPGMIPEPEGEQPDLSVRQGVQGAQGPKAAGEAAVEATPKLAVKTGEEAITPKNWEPASERLGDAKLQGVLVRDHLQMTNQKMAEWGSNLPQPGAEAGAWEAKFRGEGGQAAELRHKAAVGIQSQDNLQFTNVTELKSEAVFDKDHKHKVSIGLQAQNKLLFADAKMSMIGQKLHGESEAKLDKDLLVRERLGHAGEAVSQLSEKLPGESMKKFDKDLLVRDKVKLANEAAITMSRSESQITGGAAGVWEAKLQGDGHSAAGIDDVKGHKSVSTHKNLGQIGPESSGAQFDKDHKAFAVSENLGLAQSQNIWGERSAGEGSSKRPAHLDGAAKGIIIDNKPREAGAAIIDDNSLGRSAKGIIIDNKPGVAGAAIIDDNSLDATGKGIIQDGKLFNHK